MIVKPETVVAWHRKGFRLFWTWKVNRGKPGRPSVPAEIRNLIGIMSRNNPRWGCGPQKLCAANSCVTAPYVTCDPGS